MKKLISKVSSPQTMKEVIKYLFISAGVAAAIPLAFFAFLYFSTGDICANEIMRESISPDNQNRVVIFQRDCGAMSEFSTQISIIPAATELKNESGNIFVTSGHPDKHDIKIHWISKNSIVLAYDLNGTEYLANKVHENIKIQYQKTQAADTDSPSRVRPQEHP